MKGKRYTTEEKVRILREADAGEQSIVDICHQTARRDAAGVGAIFAVYD
jgi:transposase-like protein